MKKSYSEPLLSPTYAVDTQIKTDDRFFLLNQTHLASRSQLNDIYSHNNSGFYSTSEARSSTSYSYCEDYLLPEKSTPINCPLPNEVFHDDVDDEDLQAIEWRYDQSTRKMYELIMKYRYLRASRPYGLPIYLEHSVMVAESHVNGARFIRQNLFMTPDSPLFRFNNENHCVEDDAVSEIDDDNDSQMMFDLEDVGSSSCPRDFSN